jgi:transcriptional repressor NrdR
VKCPECGNETKVEWVHPLVSPPGVKRRRSCKNCKRRYTTHEKIVSETS